MGTYYLLITILLPVFYFVIDKFIPYLSFKSKLAVLFGGYIGSFLFPLLLSYIHPILTLVIIFSGGFGYNYYLARRITEKEDINYSQEYVNNEKSDEIDSFSAYDEAEAVAMVSAINFTSQKAEEDGWEVVLEDEDGHLNSLQEKADTGSPLKEAPLLEAAENFENVSALISQGFNARKEMNWEEAISYFEKAFSQAEGFDLKGMILSELIYLYKELGYYNKAVSVLDGYLAGSSGKINVNLENHLSRTIKYFKTLDSLLQKSGQPDLPFSAVPQLIKIKAEKAYQS